MFEWLNSLGTQLSLTACLPPLRPFEIPYVNATLPVQNKLFIWFSKYISWKVLQLGWMLENIFFYNDNTAITFWHKVSFPTLSDLKDRKGLHLRTLFKMFWMKQFFQPVSKRYQSAITDPRMHQFKRTTKLCVQKYCVWWTIRDKLRGLNHHRS